MLFGRLEGNRPILSSHDASNAGNAVIVMLVMRAMCQNQFPHDAASFKGTTVFSAFPAWYPWSVLGQFMKDAVQGFTLMRAVPPGPGFIPTFSSKSHLELF